MYKMWALSLLMLVTCSYTDIRRRQISVRVLIVFLILAAGLMAGACYFGDRDRIIKNVLLYELRPENVIFALLPGSILLVISVLTREAIGRGDVCVVGILGLMTGFDAVFVILFISMVACALCGLVFMVIKGKSKKDTLPYIPFLLGAYLVFFANNKFL